jgi:hypothetical protein
VLIAAMSLNEPKIISSWSVFAALVWLVDMQGYK